MEKIIIYGCGRFCNTFLKISDRSLFNIVAFVDENKAGEKIEGVEIRCPEDITHLQYDRIIVTTRNSVDIIDELAEKYNLQKHMFSSINYAVEHYIFPRIDDYQYVLFLSEGMDYIRFLYEDIENSLPLLVVDALPNKERWDDPDYINTDRKVFLIGSSEYRDYRESGLLSYLRMRYPNSYFAFFFYDICRGERGYETLIKDFSIEDVKRKFDVVYTYHIEEAREFGLRYSPYPYPNRYIPGVDHNIEYDLFFVGNAKDRLDELHGIYREATRNGMKCGFWITGVSEEQMIRDSDIIYNTRLTYKEYLRVMARTKVILEVCQSGDETSYRYEEAVVYHKKLLLNDESVKKRKYYDSGNFQVYHHISDIDFEWVHEAVNDYTYDNDFDPYIFMKNLGNTDKRV